MIVSVLFLLVGLPNYAAMCPSDWVEFQTSCYRIINDNKETWLGSNDICGMNGGYLAELTTEDEINFATQHVTNNTLDDSVWIGLSDILDEGIWMWTHEKMEATASDWDTNEPTNHSGEDCVRISTDTHWHDGTCSTLHYFMCEMSGANPVIG